MRTCIDCNQTKPLLEFYRVKNAQYYARTCRPCWNSKRRKYRNREAAKRYERTEAGKERQRRYRDKLRREKEIYQADLPAPVIKHFLEEAVRTEFGSVARMATAIGWSDGQIRQVYTGKAKAVFLDAVDSFVVNSQYSLPEITAAALEWAERTGDAWPKGYGPNSTGYKLRRAKQKQAEIWNNLEVGQKYLNQRNGRVYTIIAKDSAKRRVQCSVPEATRNGHAPDGRKLWVLARRITMPRLFVPIKEKPS